MRQKVILMLLISILSSHALADKTNANLTKFVASDICRDTLVGLYVDGKNDETVSQKMTQAIRDQDVLFDSKFFKEGNKCNLFIEFKIQAMTVKSKAGTSIGYAYFYQFSVFPIVASIIIDSKTAVVLTPTLYDITSFGTVGDLVDLQTEAVNSSKQVFQDFLLDWRKAH